MRVVKNLFWLLRDRLQFDSHSCQHCTIHSWLSQSSIWLLPHR